MRNSFFKVDISSLEWEDRRALHTRILNNCLTVQEKELFRFMTVIHFHTSHSTTIEDLRIQMQIPDHCIVEHCNVNDLMHHPW